MANHLEIIQDSCEKAWEALKKLNKQELGNENAKLMQELTHSLKSLSVLKKMEEEEHTEDGYSQNWWTPYPYYYDGRNSYAPRRRDNMGRYSREYPDMEHERYRYSRADGKDQMIADMEHMLDSATTEREREALRHCIQQLRNT